MKKIPELRAALEYTVADNIRLQRLKTRRKHFFYANAIDGRFVGFIAPLVYLGDIDVGNANDILFHELEKRHGIQRPIFDYT